MIDGWYTLRALAGEWRDLFVGSVLLDAFSAERDELALVIGRPDAVHTLRVSARPGRRHLFLNEGGTRPRKNVTTLFPGALGRVLADVRVADRDRMVDLDFEDGRCLRLLLYGPRANVLLGTDGGVVDEAFRARWAPAASLMPDPKPAPEVLTVDDVAARWPAESRPVEQAVTRAFPLFDRLLAGEVLARSGVKVRDGCLATRDDFRRLLDAARSVRDDLEHPAPRIYRDGREPVAFSLIPLADRPAPDEEVFESTDEAVRVFTRARLAHEAFRAEYDPLSRLLGASAARDATRSDRMLESLSQGSRGDVYERWGHLLMAARPETHGVEQVELDDLFEPGVTAVIPVDAAIGAVENAERYYARARAARRAREEAERRMEEVAERRQRTERLRVALEAVSDRTGLKAFRTQHADALAALMNESGGEGPSVPFRRFDLGSGYQVWVGRNARENDDLTFRAARKHDLWLHARGVPGSHAILRMPGKSGRPPARVLETAASIAAWFSKARGSSLVPVIVCERKYVRKPRGGAAGQVLVEREEVLLVPPVLPS